MFKVGDKILVASDLSDPGTLTVHIISKVGKDTIQCGSSEMTFYNIYCWPFRVYTELLKVMQERARLKKQYEDSITLVFELRNRVTRGEL